MNRLLLLLGAAGLLAASSCRKDDVVDCPPGTTSTGPNLLTDFTQHNGVATQAFTLALGSAAAGQTFTTKAGATLTVPGAGFVLPDGTPATGTAQVRVREIYSVPDMVLADMPTNEPHYGNMLVSGGEFNIQVWQNTTRLKLARPAQVTLTSPVPTGQDSTRQYVWYKPNATLSPDTAGWLRLNPLQRVQTPMTGFYRATLPLDSIGWWNIDQYWRYYNISTGPNGTTTQVVVNTPANALSGTRVYLRPVNFNGLSRMYPNLSTAGTSWGGTMPLGIDVVAVVLQSVNGQLYYGTQRATVTAGLVITPALTAVSETEAARLIRQL